MPSVFAISSREVKGEDDAAVKGVAAVHKRDVRGLLPALLFVCRKPVVAYPVVNGAVDVVCIEDDDVLRLLLISRAAPAEEKDESRKHGS